jgi:hypothetical protein
MANWNHMICRQEDLLVHRVLLRKWGDRLSAGHLPKILASLLKVNVYNHALIGSGCPNLPTGSDNSRFGGDETQIDSASEQHVLNPTIIAPRLLWLSTMRA